MGVDSGIGPVNRGHGIVSDRRLIVLIERHLVTVRRPKYTSRNTELIPVNAFAIFIPVVFFMDCIVVDMKYAVFFIGATPLPILFLPLQLAVPFRQLELYAVITCFQIH